MTIPIVRFAIFLVHLTLYIAHRTSIVWFDRGIPETTELPMSPLYADSPFVVLVPQ